jgi:phage gp36-like protein
VPSALNEKACAIARYKLWRDKASARVEQDYKDALAWLTQLANGTAVLADATALPTEQKPGGSAKISAPDRVFTRDSMRSL